ncbi:MAG: MOSC domain-containing protein [Puniceicoccaceae bacterium 5H]|nr:MAG: MOSC domain-containing protein [Puniceicoccaceae bacterium 5H]
MSIEPAQPRVAQIEHIWISPGHDFKGRHGKGRLQHGVVPVDAVECHAGRGLAGDRYYDYKPDFKGQLTLFDGAVADALQRAFALETLDPAAFRRNVIVRGLDLNALIGRRFCLGEVVLEGSEECAPCYWMDEAIAPGAFAWLKGRGGLRCRIRQSGWLRRGAVPFADNVQVPGM